MTTLIAPEEPSTDNASPASSEPANQPTKPSADALATNFGLIALYQVVMRTGWIFKTESIVMPAVLDMLAGPGWLRGCLPMLNRFGQSIPPLLVAGRVRATRQKKFALALCSLLMGITFCALAGIWLITGGEPTWWMPWAFLALYGLFFATTGANQLASNTVIGKLVPFDRRGRLMLVANGVGSGTAVFAVWMLLPGWLGEQHGNFFAIFGFAGVAFLIGAAISLLLVEKPDTAPKRISSVRAVFRSSKRILARDARFRRLAIVAALFGISMTLFPHYQALGREQLQLGLKHLLPWLIAQNVGTALLSIPAGWLADRFGQRLVLRILLIALSGTPLLALALARWGESGGSIFFLVFAMVGITPIAIRTFQNYCLEIAPRKHHPRYLGTLSLCMAGPAVLTSTLFGGLIDWIGFEPIFLVVAGCILAGWLLTIGLDEPRKESL